MFSSNGFSTSMRWKSETLNRHKNPGPGTYEFRTSFGHGKSWLKGRKSKFGQAQRPCLKKRGKRNQVPGPAKYNLRKSFGSEKGFYYSKKLSNQKDEQTNPGPDAYDM